MGKTVVSTWVVRASLPDPWNRLCGSVGISLGAIFSRLVVGGRLPIRLARTAKLHS